MRTILVAVMVLCVAMVTVDSTFACVCVENRTRRGVPVVARFPGGSISIRLLAARQRVSRIALFSGEGSGFVDVPGFGRAGTYVDRGMGFEVVIALAGMTVNPRAPSPSLWCAR